MGEDTNNIQYPPCLFKALHKKLDSEANVVKNIGVTLVRYLKSKKLTNDKILDIMLKWNEGHANKIEPANIKVLIKEAPRNFQISCKSLRSIAEFRDNCDEKECFRASTQALEDLAYIIESVSILKGDPTYYIFQIANKAFKVESADLMTPKTFKVWYLENFKRIITISTADWCEFVNDALEEAEESRHEEISDDTDVRETMLFHLSNCLRVTNIEDTLNDWKRGYVDNGTILMPNKSVQYFMERLKQNISPRKLAFIMRDDLADQSTTRTIEGHKIRFWVFKDHVIPDKTIFDLSDKGEESDEEGDDRPDFRLDEYDGGRVDGPGNEEGEENGEIK